MGNIVEVPLMHGQWKARSNNPQRPDGTTHQYCPPEQVVSEIEPLVEIHNVH
ncbi:hypothetical protein [Iningainema tapete]|uniref:hypothetical protein n=1 Tax=Iningainema tapete TaxID=2806730 RepID=UPI001EE15CE0|nr:hypothetical protein [Iningainema tapete]